MENNSVEIKSVEINGYEYVFTDKSDITKPVLCIPPLGDNSKPYLKLEDGTKIEITFNMCDALYRYVNRSSAADDLEYFMNDEIDEEGELTEYADEIEECKEEIIDNYIERRDSAESWWEDMRDSIEWTLGLY